MPNFKPSLYFDCFTNIKPCIFVILHIPFLEDIPESGGFEIQGIKRNKNDVYKVTIV